RTDPLSTCLPVVGSPPTRDFGNYKPRSWVRQDFPALDGVWSTGKCPAPRGRISVKFTSSLLASSATARQTISRTFVQRETIMTFVYLTTDEVNQSLALHMAAECGVTLCPLSPHETLRARAFDGVVYDWDSLPLHRQQEILTELFSGPAPLPVAIHGYNLDEGQTAALRKHGVAVYRCLQPEVFWHLRLA